MPRVIPLSSTIILKPQPQPQAPFIFFSQLQKFSQIENPPNHHASRNGNCDLYPSKSNVQPLIPRPDRGVQTSCRLPKASSHYTTGNCRKILHQQQAERGEKLHVPGTTRPPRR